jgi:Domain of unknown function (DUF4397)
VRKLRPVVVALLAMAVPLALAAPAAAGSDDHHHKHKRSGYVRAFHNSPDTPAVDIWVDGKKAVANIKYGTVTPYLKVARGWHKVEVKVAPSTKKTKAALKARLDLGRKPVTVAAIGSLTGDGKSLRLKVLKDKSGPSKRKARLRVAHTSPDAPAVDIQAKVKGKWVPVIKHLSFGHTERLTLAKGTYDLRIVAAGTNTVVKALPGVKLAGGSSSTAWAVGFLSPGKGLPGFGVKLTSDGR